MERLTEFHNGIWGMSAQAVKNGFDRYSVYSRLAAYEDTGLTPEEIEAQQQEIYHLKSSLAGCHMERQALTADKDEQAGRIMKLDNGLKRLRLSLQWLYEINTNRWYKEWAKEKIAEIDALLGGKEDV